MAVEMARIMDFVLELDRLKAVTRKVRPRGLDRYENSAEHSWHLALLALSLAPHAGPAVDIDRVLRMLLVHDIGEIDTGDTLFFIQEGRVQRKQAEEQAVARITGLLPAGQGEALLDLWREFEAGETADARFAQALDRAIPVLMNLNNDGQSWRENGIAHAQIMARVGPPIAAGCPSLWDYLVERLDAALADGWFGMAVIPICLDQNLRP